MKGRFSVACLAVGLSSSRLWCKALCTENEKSSTSTILYASSELLVMPSVSIDSRSSFSVVYDKRTRNPKYAVEILHGGGIACADDEEALLKKKKRKPFFTESSIDGDVFKSNTKDYGNARYDRGHMAPAADFICQPDMRDATFTMANVCPQSPVLNKGFWAKFEAWLRYQLTNGPYEEAIIITGPVYAPIFINNEWVFLNRTIGSFPRLVHVPTHFFKVVLLLRKNPGSGVKASNNSSGGSGLSSLVVHNSNAVGALAAGQAPVVAVAAFLVPNSDTVDSKATLASVSVRLEQLESIVGYRLLSEAFTGKVTQRLDSVVPDCRDLAQVLNGQTGRSDLVFSNGKTALLLPRDTSDSTTNSTSNSSNSSAAVVKGGAALIPVHGKNSLTSMGLVSVQHLCEQVDCNKPLFGK